MVEIERQAIIETISKCLLTSKLIYFQAQVQPDSNPCEARHSHSACNWQDKIILTGGLGEETKPINLISILQFQVSQFVFFIPVNFCILVFLLSGGCIYKANFLGLKNHKNDVIFNLSVNKFPY